MEDQKRTKKELIEELNGLRQCVAELKGFEEEIEHTRLSQEKFTKAFLQNSIPVGITTLGEGRFVDVSNAFLRLVGRNRGEVVGHTSTEIGFITEEQRLIFFKELNKRGRIENFEMKVGTKDGALRDGLFNAVMMSINNENYLLTVMTDITERKRAEEALKESEEKFSESFLKNPIPMAITSIKDGRYVDTNEAFAKVMGLKREEFIGNTSNSVGYITAEQREQFLDEYRKKGSVENLELQMRVKCGEWRHGLFNASKITIGAEDFFLTIVTDITELKKMEETLRQSEQQYRELAADYQTIVENTSEGVYRSIPEGSYTMANRAFASMLGYDSPEELLSSVTNVNKQIYVDSEQRTESIRNVMEAGHGDFEVQFKRKDGSVGWLSNSVRVVCNKQGEIKCFEGITKDISERRLVEEKSQGILNFLQTLINTIPSPIFCKDVNGQYQDCNTEFEVYTGFKKEEIIGKGVYDIYPTDVADNYHEMDLALFRRPGRQIYEQPITYADGKKHDVIVNKATYLNADGTLAGLVGVMVDITERKQAEEQLKIYHQYLEKQVQERTAELEKKNLTLSELNIALKVLLQHRDEDKKELENRFVMNVKTLIIPFAEKMKRSHLDEQQLAYLSIIETHLNEITSSMIKKMHQFNFTPTEIEVASLLKEGKATKEIARIIGIATSSINTHRNNIRKKLGISKKNINLRSHLQSFD
ncbi:MAG: PAS domain S-box protein [Syntrophales bacterium]|nr:PAS domain S-box protein [Syntrophales bacterium]